MTLRSQIHRTANVALMKARPVTRRDRAGVYLIMLEGQDRVAYVGQTSQCQARLRRHRARFGRNVKILFIPEPHEAARLCIEAALIWTIGPPENLKGYGHYTYET